MGLKNTTKSFFTKGLHFRIDKWMSIDTIQDTTYRLKQIVVDLAVPKKATRSETFDEAMDRLGLNEDDLAQRKKEWTQLYISFLIIGLTIIGYGAFMLFKGHPWVTLISAFLCMYAFGQAFRFHFWLFQLKNRRLGCSVKEWWNSQIHLKEDDSDSNSSSSEE